MATVLRRPRHNTRGERMMDLFAEAISEADTVKDASHSLGIKPTYGRVLMKRVRKELGWQAR